MLTPCHPDLIEAGCDEAGRGCLAGPVFAAAVILPRSFRYEQINDSKQLSETRRFQLRSLILREATAWAVASCSPEEIDRWNILKASVIAMHRAIHALPVKPECLLIDGNYFLPYPEIPHQCFVKGDARFLSIAAASILAKTYRDDFMRHLHREFPQYEWNRNKGYPTAQHRRQIRQEGLSPWHRRSFHLEPHSKPLLFP